MIKCKLVKNDSHDNASMSITHFKSACVSSPVDQIFYANSIPADRPDAIVLGTIYAGRTLVEQASNVIPELLHKLRPMNAYLLSRSFRCVPYTTRNTAIEDYVTPYSPYGPVVANGDNLWFDAADGLSIVMAQSYDGCICGLYLSNTLVPGGKTHSTPNCHGVLISPDSPLLSNDIVSLGNMGVVKGLLKRQSHDRYTMYTPEIRNPIGTYSKVFR